MAVIEEVVESAPSSSDSAPGGKLAEGREQEMAGAPVSDDADDLEAIEPEYDMLKAQDAKALGNSHYSAADWQLAADAYTEAIMWAPPEAEVRCCASHAVRLRADPRRPHARASRAAPRPRAGEGRVSLQPGSVLRQARSVGRRRRRLHERT